MKKVINNVSFIFSLLSFFFFGGCSHSPSSSDETVSISGTVQLEGRTDHSGVTIGLYKPVELDTAVVRLNQQYPAIGVQISQQTEFDHREYASVAQTTSNAGGSWKIDGIKELTYHVVAEKDSFGWRHLYDVDLKKHIDIDTLRRALYLNGILSQSLAVRDKIIVIENVTIPENIELTISGKSILIIAENSKLNVFGSLKIISEKLGDIRISSIVSAKWNRIHIYSNSNVSIVNCIIENGIFGIYTERGKIHLEKSIIRYNGNGFENFNVQDSLTISKNIFYKNKIGVVSNKVYGINIGENIFLNNEQAVQIISSRDCTIHDNVFSGDIIGININPAGGFGYSTSSGYINRCNFKSNQISIFLGDNSKNFSGDKNNFEDTDLYFIQAPLKNAKLDTVNFQNNFWGVYHEILIKDKIFDADDIIDDNGYFIDVRNFALSPYDKKY